MEFQAKMEPVSPPGFLSGDVGDEIDLMNMSISGIGAKLRDAIAAKDRLEVEVKKMRREILLLSETVKYEKWQKRKVEEDLKKVEEELKEQCKEEEITWMIFEEFLEAEKKKVLEGGDTIAELRSKNRDLEEELKKCNEQCEKGKKAEERYKKLLQAAKKREQEHEYRIAELEKELEKCKERCAKGKKAEERYEELLEAAKKKEQEDGNMISELRSKIRELEDEKRKAEESWKRKFMALNERVLKLEKDTELLVIGGGTHVGGSTKEKEHNGIHVHSRESRNSKADSTNSRRNGDTTTGIGQSPSNPNKDVSASGRLGLRTILIEIEDYDNDGDAACTSKGALDKKEAASQFVTDNEHPNSLVAASHLENTPRIAEGVIEMSKRKLNLGFDLDGFDISVTSSSSSESSESDMEQLLSSSRGHTIDKRRKT